MINYIDFLATFSRNFDNYKAHSFRRANFYKYILKLVIRNKALFICMQITLRNWIENCNEYYEDRLFSIPVRLSLGSDSS